MMSPVDNFEEIGTYRWKLGCISFSLLYISFNSEYKTQCQEVYMADTYKLHNAVTRLWWVSMTLLDKPFVSLEMA